MKQEKFIIRVISCLLFGIILIIPIRIAYSNPSLSDFPVLPLGAEILATSPPVPVGAGARAQGMGGAFIAVADDATAASWNPGGLGQLQKPEISIVGSYFSRSEKYSGDYIVSQGSCGKTFLDLNYLSAAYAKNIWGRNIFFSINYQKVFDFGRRVENLDLLDPLNNVLEKHNIQQEGSLYALSPAMAIEFKPGLYIGFSYNIWSDHVTGKSQWTGTVNRIDMQGCSYVKTNYKYKNFQGDNYTLGFLWKITPRLHLGGVFKKPFRANVIQESYWSGRTGQMEVGGGAEYFGSYKEAYTIDFPTAYGAGLSFRLGNSWTIAGDITRTEWQDYIMIASNGKGVGPFRQFIYNSEGFLEDIKLPKMNSTYTIRLGLEYARIMDKIVIPLRFGLFYDPEPSVGAPQDYYGMSLGCGIVMNKRLSLDFAYQYRFADKVNGDELGVYGTTAKIRQHFILSSLIFYF